MVVFLVNNENTYPKGRTLMQMDRVVPQTKRGNTLRASKCNVLYYDLKC